MKKRDGTRQIVFSIRHPSFFMCFVFFILHSSFFISRAPAQVFSSRADLVVLHVTVLDKKSGFVPGLPKEAFSVYENGKPQTIDVFFNEDTPVTVGLVIDSSGSMQRKRDAVVAAGLAFAQASHPQDEMFAVHFNEKVWPGLPAGRRFTSDRRELRQALLRSTARGQTALFDAIAFALKHLDTGREQKKVLVVVSDGGDNASRTRFDDVLGMATRMDAVIYTIGIFDEYSEDNDPDVLEKLAKVTGAEAYFPRRINDVNRVLERIATEIRSGYTIGYAPSNDMGAGAYRAIRVEVKPPDRRTLSVRTRSGYVASARTESHGH